MSAQSYGVGERPNALIIEGSMRVDVQNLETIERVNRIEDRENSDARELGATLYLGFLHGLSRTLSIGAGFGYAGATSVGGSDNGTRLGQLLLLDLRMQLVLPIQDKLDVIIVPRVGTSVLIPQGDLADRIDLARAAGFDTFRGPRFGLLLGADAGVRFMVNHWFGLRGTVGYAWTWHPLLRSSAESSIATAELKWTYSVNRVRVGLGLEARF